jgi:nucleotide-binding universal stress UspA family protein
MFRTIVVGTDGSAGAAKAVLGAAELAASQGECTLHIVTVQKPVSPTALAASEMAASAPVTAEANWEEEIRAELDRLLAEASQTAVEASHAGGAASSGLTIETHARFGNPAEVLCDMAAHLGADLLVVGNRGMRGGRRFLGSVPNTVSHHAPCSVLLFDTLEAHEKHE